MSITSVWTDRDDGQKLTIEKRTMVDQSQWVVISTDDNPGVHIPLDEFRVLMSLMGV